MLAVCGVGTGLPNTVGILVGLLALRAINECTYLGQGEIGLNHIPLLNKPTYAHLFSELCKQVRPKVSQDGAND